VPVDVEAELLAAPGALDEIGRRFDAEHRRLFMFDLDTGHEVVNLRAVVTARAAHVAAPRLAAGGPDPGPARTGSVAIWVDGAEHAAGLYDRARLLAGNVVPGPAVVTEMDSTTLVLPGHVATVDDIGNLIIRPEEG